jgi:hypothetical protein
MLFKGSKAFSEELDPSRHRENVFFAQNEK